MARGLLDTSVFIGLEVGRPVDLDALPDEFAVSAITIGELVAGVLSATEGAVRARRLSTLSRVEAFRQIPLDGQIAHEWAALRSVARDRGLTARVNDLWIAATARHLRLPLFTQDGDFSALADAPGLEVIHV